MDLNEMRRRFKDQKTTCQDNLQNATKVHSNAVVEDESARIKAEDDTNMRTALLIKDNGGSYIYYYYRNGQVRVGEGSLFEVGGTLYANGRIISSNESFKNFVDNMGLDTIAVFSYKNVSDYLAYHKIMRGRLIYEPQVLMLSQISKEMPNNVYNFSFRDSYCLVNFDDGIYECLDSGYFNEKREFISNMSVPVSIADDISLLLFEGLLNQIKIMLGINIGKTKEPLFMSTTSFPILVLGKTDNYYSNIIKIDRNTMIPIVQCGVYEKNNFSEFVLKLDDEVMPLSRHFVENVKDGTVKMDIDANNRIEIVVKDNESKYETRFDIC